MYCPKCGTEIPDASTFCLKCGNKVIDPAQILQSHKNSNILFISTIVVVLLGIGALYLLLRNHDSDDAKLAANRPSPSPSLAPSPLPSPSPSPSPSPITDIHAVNFKKMSYKLGDATVRGSDETVQVMYGDLDGDGIDEAAVSLTYTAGSGTFSKGLVYAIKEGKVQRLAEVDGGDKANGGIIKAQIKDGKFEVERCRVDETDNSLSIETTTYQLAEARLTQLGKTKRKTITCP